MAPTTPPAPRGPDRSLWSRTRGRIGREFGAVRGAWSDARQLQALKRRQPLSARELRAAAARLAEDPGRDPHARAGMVWRVAPAAQLEDWRRAHPEWSEQAVMEAGDARRDRARLFGHVYRFDHPDQWHRDPLRAKPWPRRSRAFLKLDQPRRSGDVRMQWEMGRFHHALLLGRAWIATQDPAYVEAFLRHVESFERGNPPYRGVHWAVGMEVALRAAALIFSLEFFRGARALSAAWRERLMRLLLLHGLFLEQHIERHPYGFTTNHTTSDYAGLAVLGRFFARYDCGQRWLAQAAEGLAACLQEQVLIGGAHAEASLLYERYVLEAALVGALALDQDGTDTAEPLRRPIKRMAQHVRDACLPSGLPFVGDGDESFFPPFGFRAYVARDPFDPEPALQVAAAWLRTLGLRMQAGTREEAFWLGALLADRPQQPRVHADVQEAAQRREEEAHFWEHRGKGHTRFSVGPFEGVLISRGAREGWMPTHGHNDLLSVTLDVAGQALLIDPGTGGYGCDRELRHQLRATAAHTTVQLDALEQSPLKTEAIFEGPATVPGGVDQFQREPLRLCAWHGGFVDAVPQEVWWGNRTPGADRETLRRSWDDAWAGYQHTRRLSWRLRGLCLEDVVFVPVGTEGRRGADGDPQREHTTVIRFVLAPGLAARLLGDGDPHAATGGGDLPRGSTAERHGSECRVAIAGGEMRFLLLRPREALWQIRRGYAARRYGDREAVCVLEATQTGPLPHRWLTALHFLAPGR